MILRWIEKPQICARYVSECKEKRDQKTSSSTTLQEKAYRQNRGPQQKNVHYTPNKPAKGPFSLRNNEKKGAEKLMVKKIHLPKTYQKSERIQVIK